LGIPTASTTSLIDNPSEYEVRSNYHGFFFQDDWRVNSRLTLNVGLRYEWESGLTEKENRIVTGFDTVSVNPLNSAVQANFATNPPPLVPAFTVLGGFTFATPEARVNQSTDKNNFQPRIGVSYSLNDKTVLRGGFGIFSAPFQIQAVNQAGFSTPTLFVPSTNNGLTFIAGLSNPFPSGVAPSPGSSLGLLTFAGRDLITTNATGATSVLLSHARQNAQYARFVGGIQREVALGIAVEANVVYSRGFDLAVNRIINYIPTQYLNAGNAFDSATQTFLNTMVSNPFRGLIPSSATYNANTIQRRLLLVPYPAFGNVAVTEYNGYSTYKALQLQLTKRYTQGLSLNASYTYSREREALTRLNPQDAELTEQVAANDRPHRLTFSFIYELPIGRNRWIGSNWNKWVDGVIGGWQVQANYERQSGEPLLLGNVYFEGDPSTLENKLGQKDSQGRRYGVDIPAFDITKFYPGGIVNTGAAAIGLGNIYTITGSNTLRYFPLALDNFRNQRFLNFNIGLSKNFRINESMKFQLRVEAINALNNPYFNAVNLTPTSSTFGFTNGQRQPPRDIQIGGKFTF
jgi:hypothetical protein